MLARNHEMTLRRIATLTALTLILAPTFLYLGDYFLWLIRGQPTSTVHVTRIVVAPLKGGREEYYSDGSADLVCSRSLFRQAGSGSCWRLQRNPTIYDR